MPLKSRNTVNKSFSSEDFRCDFSLTQRSSCETYCSSKALVENCRVYVAEAKSDFNQLKSSYPGRMSHTAATSNEFKLKFLNSYVLTIDFKVFFIYDTTASFLQALVSS